jgi:hypothetical protein
VGRFGYPIDSAFDISTATTMSVALSLMMIAVAQAGLSSGGKV